MFVAIVVVGGAQVHDHGLHVVVAGLVAVVAAHAQLHQPAVAVVFLTA